MTLQDSENGRDKPGWGSGRGRPHVFVTGCIDLVSLGLAIRLPYLAGAGSWLHGRAAHPGIAGKSF